MIEAYDLTRRFGATLAVDRLSLRVPDGTIAALLGPNGAGKTTTVRMLAGLLAPSAGAATVAGHDVRRDPAGVRARVGLVTDVPGLYEQMNLPAYLDFFGDIYGLPKATRQPRIADLIAFFDLAGHQRERMVGFSKGMKQKVALARALLHEPDVLFLDEPTSGLDPLAARAVRDLIVSLKGSHRAIVLCTHDLDEAERLADQVVIIRQGHVVAAGPPANLRASASHDTLVRIELAAPCPPALGTLGALVGISAPTWDSETPPVLTYRTPQPRDVNPEALAALVAIGARVVSVTCTTQTLEDVYASAMNEHADGLATIGGTRQ
jgi:ABC-2 type transport system ATP-binding protein